MTWNAEYYDQMERLYWQPNRLGCRRIVQLCDTCRKSKPDAAAHGWMPVKTKLKRDEVPLNDILNLFLRIAPARLPSRLFGPCFGADMNSVPFAFVGHELQSHPSLGQANITQPDVFLSAEDTTLMIEIKINARSSRLQIAKYALLAGLEEQFNNSRKALFLLYLTPRKPLSNMWAERFQSHDELSYAFRDYDPRQCGKPLLVQHFKDHYDLYRSATDRLQIGFMTYSEIIDALRRERAAQNTATDGEETLARLIDGLISELEDRKVA